QALDPKRVRATEETTQAERQLIQLVLANADVRRAILSNLKEEEYAELATGAIFTALISMEEKGVEPDFSTLSELIESDADKEMLSALLMSDLAWAGGDDFETLFKKATEALVSLRKRRLERRLETIQIEIGQAEREQDGERVLRLYQE